MVLDDVADDAEASKWPPRPPVPRSSLKVSWTDSMCRVPRRLEALVRPAQRRDVQDDLLAEVVDQAVELGLVEVRRRPLVEVSKVAESRPKGFSIIRRVLAALRRAALPRARRHRAEDRRHFQRKSGCGQIAPRTAHELVEALWRRVVVAAGVEADAREEPPWAAAVLLDVTASRGTPPCRPSCARSRRRACRGMCPSSASW